MSLDEKGDQIEFIPKRYTVWARIDGPSATFVPDMNELQDKLRSLDSAISERMKRAISRLNFPPFANFSNRAESIRGEISHFEYNLHRRSEFDHDDLTDIIAFSGSRLQDSIDLHSSIFDELDHSGIIEIVDSEHKDISRIPSRFILPMIDGAQVREEEVGDDSLNWSHERHRSLLGNARRLREDLLTDSLFRSGRDTEQPDEQGGGGKWWRYAGASLRVLAGTGVAVGNTGLALTAGLTSTIVTIGATAVPTYVGVLGSICAGLAQAADGLEKIGQIQAENQQRRRR